MPYVVFFSTAPIPVMGRECMPDTGVRAQKERRPGVGSAAGFGDAAEARVVAEQSIADVEGFLLKG